MSAVAAAADFSLWQCKNCGSALGGQCHYYDFKLQGVSKIHTDPKLNTRFCPEQSATTFSLQDRKALCILKSHWGGSLKKRMLLKLVSGKNIVTNFANEKALLWVSTIFFVCILDFHSLVQYSSGVKTATGRPKVWTKMGAKSLKFLLFFSTHFFLNFFRKEHLLQQPKYPC